MSIPNPYSQHPHLPELLDALRSKEPAGKESGSGESYILEGLAGSSRAALVQAALNELKGAHLFLFKDKEEAAYFYTDLTTLDGGPDRTLFFPSSYKRSIQYQQSDEANIITRTQTLRRLAERRVSSFIVSYAEALVESVVSRRQLRETTLELKQGEKVDMAFVEEVLQTYGFQLVDFVNEPGQYAIRGGILDVFSYAASHPHRIDFFDEEVDSIRSFDADSQRSVETVKKLNIIPNIQWETEMGEKRISFLEYLPAETVLWMDEPELICEHIQELYDKTSFAERDSDSNPEDEAPKVDKARFLKSGDAIQSEMRPFRKVIFGRSYTSPGTKSWRFNTSPQPAFQKNFELLTGHLQLQAAEGYENHLLSDSEKQLDRMRSIFSETDPELNYFTSLGTVHEGFSDHDLKCNFYTDHQIFERYHRFKFHDRFSKKESLSAKQLIGLNPGDYVVHVDHGIGIFGGLEKVEVNGRIQESIKLVYKDRDVLYVNIHSLHRISKYKGKDTEAPKIYKLGTGAWQKLKQNTRKKVKDIARELILLYARRRDQKGFAFSPDTYLQQELESSFIYEDTPDQLKATADVKAGMEAGFPMDRLICGDVGFGKTEVAIRAAFKAVSDSKQVAVLVPTTVLAFQHYNTFKDRLKNFPCTVDYLSRFRTAAEQREILKKLENGQIDIIIGTHKLVGKEVGFRDLGLLIVDEEQKFGVSVKEKLKQFKLNVDTLTLTATPIPRTLQFSLMGSRDLSIINTPPPNRHPIITELHPFNEEIIKEAVEYEISRGGQVFFIHNRVQNIMEIKETVDRVVPAARSVVAHGQMDGKKLESIMLDFMQGDYDVLIATTIVESGLDIPNANTIIINNGHNFGLSDLHQLRGRVGRSNKKAFCYIFAPPLTVLSQESRRRLKAVEEFSALGSGFNIAMQDLDIRGAGNLLGAEQSGFIADIGFETYNRILNEAIQELKDSEFSSLYDEKPEKPAADVVFLSDCHIDTDLELLFPDSYIANIPERVDLYRRLDLVKDEAALEAFREMLSDRFGPLPEAARQLLEVVRLRWLAQRIGVEKIILKKNTLITYFVSNPEAPFYASQKFREVIANIQANPLAFRMREEEERLSLRSDKVETISDAHKLLQLLNKGQSNESNTRPG
ncbi:MAG: transcription-repair coupling factor [Bacteroidetes bacterium]|nr:MAG: transcription-repair coupling factor [Bacteroidota bacterium]